MTPTGKVGIVGGGSLAGGLAQLCLQAGLEVLLIDDTQDSLDTTEGLILRGLHRAEQPSAFGLLRKATRLNRLEECDLAVECAAEAPEAKLDLLVRMDARLEPGRPLCVQTAALPVGIVARMVENPDRVAGVHFMPPACATPLVEVIAGAHTDEKTMGAALDFAKRLGKTAVRCKDAAGFVVNRLSRPFYRAALRLLEEGRGTPASIDDALRASGLRAGPFEALDFYGLDEELSVWELVYELLGRPARLEPPALLKALLARGASGRKREQGFFVYDDEMPKTVNPLLAELVQGFGRETAEASLVLRRVLDEVLPEARALVADGVASEADVDTAARLALHWPRGPFEWEMELKK